MKIEPKANCPLDGFNPCRQLECAWFLKISGKDPQSNKEVDEWGCSMAWLPIMMIENSQQQRQTSSAVESFRNEMVKSNEVGQRVLLATAGVPHKTQEMILEMKQ
jgi:hypothetical protein